MFNEYNNLSIEERKKFKRCTKCIRMKNVTEFYKQVGTPDGRRADCIECRKPK
jgi:hypothetical protein